MPKAFDIFRVKATFPEELSALHELAHNLRWSWRHDTIELFRRLDPDLWESTNHNPVRILGMIEQKTLEQLVDDDAFMAHLYRAYEDLQEYLAESTWYESNYGATKSPLYAYFSMEFGLTECLPVYSGGLGILAGDHLKSASDLGIPLVGIGLLYQQGYFQQYLNSDGWQQETYPFNDFYNLPIKLEVNPDGSPLTVSVTMVGRVVHCRIWRAVVGRVKLYLLDTNDPRNSPDDRHITNQLYGGDAETRIKQEIVLGIAGKRALRALGLNIHVCHMNEGHAAFMALERLNLRINEDKLDFDSALQVVRSGTIFTTHTPVPAGIDNFPADLIETYLKDFCSESKIAIEKILPLGRSEPEHQHQPFNMALLALRTTSYANGVSELHGAVSREMWQAIWPQIPIEEVPIKHITNGIHTQSWVSGEMAALLTRYLGPDWMLKPGDQSIWRRVEKIPEVELWRVHERRRETLVSFARSRAAEQSRRRGGSQREINAATEILNPEALTIGFARRFATYKRATLLLRDPARLKKLLSDNEKPVQIIIAGKAHPRDNAGKELIRQWLHFASREGLERQVIFLENYDMNVARYLVEGVDIWLNNPRRPMEASGTSGMKVIANGGLNLSVLDGWWAEGYHPDLGWSIGNGEEYSDSNYQDDVESTSLYNSLEHDIIPLFYRRSSDGLPREWVKRMKRSMSSIGAIFNTNRMVKEYAEHYYLPSEKSWKHLSTNSYSQASELAKWLKDIKNSWDSLEIVSASIEKKGVRVGKQPEITAIINRGKLTTNDIWVEVYSGPLDADYNITRPQVTRMTLVNQNANGESVYSCTVPLVHSGLFGYSVRVMPWHQYMPGDGKLIEMMKWIAPASPAKTG
ncbi:MAG: alpha-glucan family phosphorylase [bacterium]|nr:alpha-glucan family phosphorylase [bacterium]